MKFIDMAKLSSGKRKMIIIVMVMIVAIPSFMLGSVLGLSGGSTWANQTTYIGPGSMISEASYIIFIDESGAICAKNGTNGKIDYRSSNASEIINSAINNVPDGSTIFIGSGNYICEVNIVIHGRDRITITGEHPVLTLVAYASIRYPNIITAQPHSIGILAIHNSTNILFDSIDFNGDKTHQSTTTYLAYIVNSKDVTFTNCIFQDANYKAMAFINSPTVHGQYNRAVVENCQFINNCDTSGTDSDIYCELTNYLTFRDCSFRRNAITDSKTQAFYMNGYGRFEYDNLNFENMAYCYDVRSGTHIITNTDANNTYAVLLMQSAAGNPAVQLNGALLTNVSGEPVSYNLGIYVVTGTLTASNIHMIAKPGSSDAYFGIRLRYGAHNCVIQNNIIDGFVYGVYSSSDNGNHTISDNYIENATNGIASESHTASSMHIFASNNIFYNVASYRYYNGDGFLDVESRVGYVTYAQGYATMGSGNNSVTIYHGLEYTPQVILVSSNDPQANATYVYAADGNVITIRVPSAVSHDCIIYWYARMLVYV